MPAMQTEPSGASVAFTSDDPVVKRAVALMNKGKFNDAESLLASNGRTFDREETKEIIRRMRQEYSLDAAQVLAKLKKDIPDVIAADLDRWTQANEAQHRVIDGQLKYFNREPSNIYRF